jgi:hypothetical protein
MRNGRVPIVIIDDVHRLPIDTLKFVLELSRLRHQDELYSIVLFADLSINDRLNHPMLKDVKPDQFHHFRIPSFSKEQTGKYLDYRLSLSGQCKMNPFTDDDIQKIFKESAGLPGNIHVPARQIMQEFDVPGRTRKVFSKTVINAIVCLVVFVVVYSGMSNDYKEKTTTKISIAIPIELPNDISEAENLTANKTQASKTRSP